MKEAFWGVLIVMLGLFGIVVVNLFQKVTITNDEVYYVIKESTEASMYDAIDLTRYRLTGKIRIVEDKFVENLTRRFAQNVSKGNYTIVVQDINEDPPKVSVVVNSGISSIQGDKFTISNRVDGIIETKYTLDELLDYLKMSEEEWNNITKDEEDKNICDMLKDPSEYECIPKDIKFGNFEDYSVPSSTCSLDTGKKDVPLEVTYYTCECGKWIEEKETVYASGIGEENSIKYTWTFNKTGEYRNISETITKRTKFDVCTTSIDVMVPKDLRNEEPSSDNSLYVPCGSGIRIPEGTRIVLHGGYTPTNATNRTLLWTKDSDAISLSSTKSYVSKKSYSRAIMVASKVEKGETKESNVTATSTLNQTATCKVTVWDGSVDSLSCKDLELLVGATGVIVSSYEPYNATKTDFEYSLEDPTVGIISGNNITINKNSPTKIIIKDKYTGKTNTCNLKVSQPVSSATYDASSGGYWRVIHPDGTSTYTTSYEEAKKAADGNAKINVNNGYGETNYGSITSTTGGAQIEKTPDKTITTLTYPDKTVTTIKDAITGTVETETVYNKTTSDATDVSGGSYDGGGYDPGWGQTSHGCFLEGTVVLTKTGYKNIEKILPGDMVLSYNIVTKKKEYKKVLRLYIHEDTKDVLYSLMINNNEIEVTSAHPFYVKYDNSLGYKWVAAKNLKIGDLLMDSKGNYYPITSIKYKNISSTIYNIEVEDNHNYYVTKNNILVHNLK